MFMNVLVLTCGTNANEGGVFSQRYRQMADVPNLEKVRLELERLEHKVIDSIASCLQREAQGDIADPDLEKSETNIGMSEAHAISYDGGTDIFVSQIDHEYIVESAITAWLGENFRNTANMQDELRSLLEISLERIELGRHVAEAKFSFQKQLYVEAKEYGNDGILNALTDVKVERRVVERVMKKAQQQQEAGERLGYLCSEYYAKILIPATKHLQVTVLQSKLVALKSCNMPQDPC